MSWPPSITVRDPQYPPLRFVTDEDEMRVYEREWDMHIRFDSVRIGDKDFQAIRNPFHQYWPHERIIWDPSGEARAAWEQQQK